METGDTFCGTFLLMVMSMMMTVFIVVTCRVGEGDILAMGGVKQVGGCDG